jgi:hypothetical protein
MPMHGYTYAYTYAWIITEHALTSFRRILNTHSRDWFIIFVNRIVFLLYIMHPANVAQAVICIELSYNKW